MSFKISVFALAVLIPSLLISPAAMAAAWPAQPPAPICGNKSILRGPAKAPAGAITVPAGDNSTVDFGVANATYWFAPGVHTLGNDQFSQIMPGDGATFIGGPKAVLDGQRINRYAFTQHAVGVTIAYLTIQHFGAKATNIDEGVVNHDAGDSWTIRNNTIRENAGAGVFVGSHNVVDSNCITKNGQYGFSMYKPPKKNHSAIVDIALTHNEISFNNADNIERVTGGCGCTGGGKFWDVKGAKVLNNWVHDNKSVGLWADTDDIGFRFEGNYIADNDAEGIFYEISYNAVIRNNTFLRNAQVKGRKMRAGNFPVGAIYLSESGGDARVYDKYATLDISGNHFEDNWSGVILWENADRFCNSPSNTSGGYCTKGGAATLRACVQGKIEAEPYYADCRWKTQNVSVHDNEFHFDPAKIADCAGSLSCGQQGVFSNYGTYPSWSPYKGEAISQAITFHQNNVFMNNAYFGPWGFTAYDASRKLSFGEWRAAPYGQDAGSTVN
ncbi:MAG TPA: right-handed parallel beta-helix repeat-containing protein [Rhizomicrobium sp.]|jgi:parallel beta-helix repeat protein|nr:right-handed parallel beta-helix repeat-containing protein [Rhizomicrobium sp.]